MTPSNRVGGIDLLIESLSRQTETDFELVFVDALRRFRPEAFRSAPFRVKHIEPRDNPFPRVSYCAAMNTGIAHSSGEVIVAFCDYTFASPRCLETHAECQKQNPGPTHLDYNYTALPKLKSGFPGYHQGGMDGSDPRYVETINATTDRYVADLESGALDPFMWSIFEEPLTEESVAALEVTHRHRPCGTRKADDWNWASCKNESIPTELLLELNGFNEALDESHCYQDSELSYRLRRRGIPWNNGPVEQGMVSVVNPRPVLNVKRLAKPISHNRDVCDAQLGTLANPEFSLREWRERMIRA